jgi:hypothetical protein
MDDMVGHPTPPRALRDSGVLLTAYGQSIPFGRNWVATVEQALDSSALMFSFLSPVSTGSAWINFEAGYAYARGVKVVPVAILGKDLNTLHPPLSLLQGFNLKSHEGLNNLLSVINATFSTSYSLSFTAEDYSELFTEREKAVIVSFGKASSYIERISMEFLADETLFDEIKCEIVGAHGNAFINETVVAVSGIEAKRRRVDDEDFLVTISVAPAFFQLNIPLLKRLAARVGPERGRVVIRLNHSARVNYEMWELTGKFHGTAVKAIGEGFEFEGIVFEIGVVGYEVDSYDEESSPIWGVTLDQGALDRPERIKDLLDLLVGLVIREEDDIPF